MKFFAKLAVLSSLAITAVQAVTNFRGLAVSNSPSTGSYTCRTVAQWEALAANAKANGFRTIRIIGMDCGALIYASAAAANHGLTLLVGIWAEGSIANSAAQIKIEVDQFYDAYKWFGASRYVGLTIGNELYDNPQTIINKVNEMRNYLRGRGVNIPMSTVHTWVHIRDNRVLCNVDFVAANAHAFYDGNVVSERTGDFVFKTVVPALKAACPGKGIWITESGWPSRGPANGKARASVADAKSALLNLNCACRDDRTVNVLAFEADDQHWKGNDWERSFGMFGKYNLAGEVFAPC